MNKVKQLVSRGAAKLCLAYSLGGIGVCAHMFEQNKRGYYFHFAFAGASIMLVHVQNGLKQDIQVVVIKSGFGG